MSWEDGVKKFNADLKEIIDTCQVDEGLAACYLCNFEDEYICHTHNGGCKKIWQCKDIQEKLPNI